MFYGLNTFVVIDDEASAVELLEIMQAWLNMIGPSNASMLSCLKISRGPQTTAASAELLKRFGDVFVQAGGKAMPGVAELIIGSDLESLEPYFEAS